MYEIIKKNRVLSSCVLGLVVIIGIWLCRPSKPEVDPVSDQVRHAAGSEEAIISCEPIGIAAVLDETEPEEEFAGRAATETVDSFMFLPGPSIDSEVATNAPSITQNGATDLDVPITIRNLPLDAPLGDESASTDVEETTESGTDGDKKVPPPAPWAPVVVQNVFSNAPLPRPQPCPQAGWANHPMPGSYFMPSPMMAPMMPMVPCRPMPVMRYVGVPPMVPQPVIGATVRPCRFVYHPGGILVLPSNRYATLYFVP